MHFNLYSFIYVLMMDGFLRILSELILGGVAFRGVGWW